MLVSSTAISVNSIASWDVAVSGNYALATNNQLGLAIYDVTNPAAPALMSHIGASPGPLQYMDVSGNYAYVLNGGYLDIFNFANPAAPVLVDSIALSSTSPSSVWVAGHYIYVTGFSKTLEVLFFADGIITTAPTTLASIVSSECLESNLITANDIDTTSLTDSVRGYKIATMSAIRAALEPLRGAWPFDVVQHGYQLRFLRRGGTSVVTIPWDQLDARQSGNTPGVRVTNSREMDSILPATVALSYFDLNAEYAVGEQDASRLNTDAVNTQAVTLPVVLTADEAAQKAEILLYLYWMERYDVSFVLPPTYQYLEPSDIVTITTDDATYTLRLTSISYLPDGRMECAAKYHSSATYTSTATGQTASSSGSVLSMGGPTAYELLDIPTLSDSFNIPGFPAAMSGFLAGWPGGTLVRSSDLQAWTALQWFTPPGGVLGLAANTLSSHPGTLIDKAGSLHVQLYQGALSSITEGQMLNGGNYFAYGVNGRWEIIAAQNCTLQPDGTYILTDLLRGRFGTEWATGQHASGDHLVLLATNFLAFISMDTNSIGATRYYRGITLGQDITTDINRTFAYQAVNLECLAPVNLNGNRTANDWNLTWMRRTRVGGEWRDYVDATLGETTEAYDVDIFSDNTYTAVKRTISVTAPAATYTSAQQVTDFGSNQPTLYLRIYQKSAVVGRGYYLQSSITR